MKWRGIYGRALFWTLHGAGLWMTVATIAVGIAIMRGG